MSNPRHRELLEQRVILSAQLKGNNGMLILDKEEEYSQKNFTFAGLPEISYQALQAVSGAADIPITRFLGQSPAGLSSTGESDLKNYYDAVNSMQALIISPALEDLDECLIRSALGDRPEDVDYQWASLWQMDDEQKSKISKETADTIKVLADCGLFPDDDLAEAAANLLVEHSILPSFEFDPAKMEEERQANMEMAAAIAAPNPDPNADPDNPAGVEEEPEV
jgi:phage-related protein (TIGR01555 family)